MALNAITSQRCSTATLAPQYSCYGTAHSIAYGTAWPARLKVQQDITCKGVQRGCNIYLSVVGAYNRSFEALLLLLYHSTALSLLSIIVYFPLYFTYDHNYRQLSTIMLALIRPFLIFLSLSFLFAFIFSSTSSLLSSYRLTYLSTDLISSSASLPSLPARQPGTYHNDNDHVQ